MSRSETNYHRLIKLAANISAFQDRLGCDVQAYYVKASSDYRAYSNNMDAMKAASRAYESSFQELNRLSVKIQKNDKADRIAKIVQSTDFTRLSKAEKKAAIRRFENEYEPVRTHALDALESEVQDKYVRLQSLVAKHEAFKAKFAKCKAAGRPWEIGVVQSLYYIYKYERLEFTNLLDSIGNCDIDEGFHPHEYLNKRSGPMLKTNFQRILAAVDGGVAVVTLVKLLAKTIIPQAKVMDKQVSTRLALLIRVKSNCIFSLPDTVRPIDAIAGRIQVMSDSEHGSDNPADLLAELQKISATALKHSACGSDAEELLQFRGNLKATIDAICRHYPELTHDASPRRVPSR